MTDPVLMHTAASDLLTALEVAAEDIGWTLAESCVMPYEPASDCVEGIYVWPSGIDPRHLQGCQVSSLVTLRFWLVQCGNVNDCGDSATRSPTLHSNVWGTWAGLLNLWHSNDIFSAPCQCEDVRFGNLELVEGTGDVVVWAGSVTMALSPSEA